jgi:hypothetical protein
MSFQKPTASLGDEPIRPVGSSIQWTTFGTLGPTKDGQRNRSLVDEGFGPSAVLRISFTIRFSDLLSMYLGSWAARIAALPGFVFLVIVLAAWPPPADIPIGSYLGMLIASVGFLVLGPLLLTYFLFGMYGARSLVGSTVHLQLDETGLAGWPLAPELDREWTTVRRVRRLRGVTTLPFRQFGTRAGWVAVPDRAMSQTEFSTFFGLLIRRGLAKKAPGRT